MIDSVIEANKKYYPQILLEENTESDSDSNNEIKSDTDTDNNDE